ncbi:MAG: hypothetical protein ACMG57_00965 [Candidatus Dojkabacteria bacterium]
MADPTNQSEQNNAITPITPEQLLINNYQIVISKLVMTLELNHDDEVARLLQKETEARALAGNNWDLISVTPELDEALERLSIEILNDVSNYLQKNSYLLEIGGNFETEQQQKDYNRVVSIINTFMFRGSVSSSTTSLTDNRNNDMQNNAMYLEVVRPFAVSSINLDASSKELKEKVTRELPENITLKTLLALSLDKDLSDDEFKVKFVKHFEGTDFNASEINLIFSIFTKYLSTLGHYSYIKTIFIVQDLVANLIKQMLGNEVAFRNMALWGEFPNAPEN